MPKRPQKLLIVFRLVSVGLIFASCGGQKQARTTQVPATGYATSVGLGAWSQMKIEPSGRVFGENFDLATTENGYRGIINGQLSYMGSDTGDRIFGSVGGHPIDVHLWIEEGTLGLQGLFAGRLGRIELDAVGLRGSCNRCDYQLHRLDGGSYQGERACFGNVGPASVALPPGFGRFVPYRQAMLLATLLCL